MNIHYNSPRPATNLSPEEDKVDLREYWKVLKQHKFGIISLGLIAAVLTALVMLQKNNIYESTATLLIISNGANVTSIEELYDSETGSREYFNTQFQLLRNRNLAETVIQQLNLLEHQGFQPDEDSGGFSLNLNWRDYLPSSIKSSLPGEAAQSSIPTEELLLEESLRAFNENLRITPLRDTDLVKVSYFSKDAQLAADIANTLANVYINADREQRMQSTQEASQWLSGRLLGLRQTLDQSELRLQEYLDQEQLIEIEGVASLNIQQLDELTTQSLIASQSRTEAENNYRQIQSLQNPSMEALLSFPAISNYPSIAALQENTALIEQQIAELSNRYGRRHPRMIALTAEQNAMEDSLLLQVQLAKASLLNDYVSSVDNENTTLARLDASKSDLQSINRKTFELRELQRDVDTSRELYDLFFNRIRETDETSDFQTANAVLVDPAVKSIEKVGPARSRAVMSALFIGIIFGSILALIRNAFDSTLKNHTDIEEQLKTAVLGVVPLIKRKQSPNNKDKAYLGFLDDRQSVFSESIRTIRASITLSSLDRPYKIIEITSSTPNEGKTTLAVNLASAMAQMSRVLLIDTDLRRRSLQKSIGLPAKAPGLTDYLAGTAKIRNCFYRYKKANIVVMPAGSITPNPQELLSSLKFKHLLHSIADQYDHIILDTPPTQSVMDALILAPIADATIFVAKANVTPIKLIKAELIRLKQANANIIGTVLNQVDVSKKNSENYGGYYDSYGYTQLQE